MNKQNSKSTFNIDFVKMEAMAVARLQFSFLDMHYSMSNKIRKHIKMTFIHDDIVIFDVQTSWAACRLLELSHKCASFREVITNA